MCLLVFDLIIELNTHSLVLIKTSPYINKRTIETITSIVLLFYLYYIAIRGTLNSSRRKSKLFAKKIENLREQLYNFSFIPSKQYAVDRGLDGFSEVFLQYDLNVASEKYLLLLVYYLRA